MHDTSRFALCTNARVLIKKISLKETAKTHIYVAWGMVKIIFHAGSVMHTCSQSGQGTRNQASLQSTQIILGKKGRRMTKVKSDMPPMLRLLEHGEFHPGLLRPLKGVSSSEPSRE